MAKMVVTLAVGTALLGVAANRLDHHHAGEATVKMAALTGAADGCNRFYTLMMVATQQHESDNVVMPKVRGLRDVAVAVDSDLAKDLTAMVEGTKDQIGPAFVRIQARCRAQGYVSDDQVRELLRVMQQAG